MLKTSTDQRGLLANMNVIAQAPGGVARLRELILTLAVQGKLVAQDASDEPASELLKKIRAEKDRLIAERKIKKDKPLPAITEDEKPFELPVGWTLSCLGEIGVINPKVTAQDDDICSFVQMSSISIDFLEKHLSEDRPWKNIKKGFTQFSNGDVGLAKITPCFENGKSTVFEDLKSNAGAGTTELHIVRPLAGINPRYILAFLKTPAFLKNGESVMTGSAGQKRVPRSYFESAPLPLPPLAEQSRIVARVEELMRLCDALEEKGRLEQTQHQQLLQAMLDSLTQTTDADELARHWQRLAQHFDLLIDRPEAVDALEQTILQLAVRGLLVPQEPSDEPAYKSLLSINDAKNLSDKRDIDFIFLDGDVTDLPNGWCRASVAALAYCLDYMRKPVKKDLRGGDNAKYPYYGANGQVGYIEDYIFDEDLVLVVEDETFIGRLKPFSYFISGKSWVNNHAHVLRAKEGIIPQYLNMCLERYDFVPITSGTTNRRKLTKKGLLSAQLIFPPLAEQSRIVARVTELRALCQQLRDKLTQARTTQTQLAQAWVEQVAA